MNSQVNQYRAVQALMTRHATIKVERFEVSLPSGNPGDPETWRTGYVPDDILERAYVLLGDKYAVELEEICVQLIMGEIK